MEGTAVIIADVTKTRMHKIMGYDKIEAENRLMKEALEKIADLCCCNELMDATIIADEALEALK